MEREERRYVNIRKEYKRRKRDTLKHTHREDRRKETERGEKIGKENKGKEKKTRT